MKEPKQKIEFDPVKDGERMVTFRVDKLTAACLIQLLGETSPRQVMDATGLPESGAYRVLDIWDPGIKALPEAERQRLFKLLGETSPRQVMDATGLPESGAYRVLDIWDPGIKALPEAERQRLFKLLKPAKKAAKTYVSEPPVGKTTEFPKWDHVKGCMTSFKPSSPLLDVNDLLDKGKGREL